MTAVVDIDEWFSEYAGRKLPHAPLFSKSRKRSNDDDNVVIDLDNEPSSPTPVDVDQPRKRMAARISEMATKEVLAVSAFSRILR